LSESDLIVRAQSGDIQAFEALIRSYDRKVLGFALRLLKNPDDAKDAYQDVFLKAFQALPGFRHKSQFSTWLYKIAYHTCVNYMRKRKTIQERLFFSEDEENRNSVILRDKNAIDPEEDFLQKELAVEIEKIVRTFSPQMQAIFYLRYQNELSLKEISSATGLSLNSVKNYLFRMHGKLRRQLTNYLKG